jgi:parvulin-like peptidyl-prolyl isomerase
MMVGIVRLTAPMAESFMIQNQFLTSPPDEDTTLLDSLVWITPENAVTGPVKGTHGYYFLRVLSKSIAPTEADFQRDRERYTREFGERYRERLLTDLMAKVKQYAEVEDLRPGAQISPPSSQGRASQ